MIPSIRRLLKNSSGAVAPTVALSLFGLIAAGGIAFDYARMAGLDTELQNAADQAALAAATQLDQTDGSMQRATAAAQGLITNNTLFANEANSTRAVTIPTVVFYATKADAENDANGFTDTSEYASANFVRVAVGARRALFALTPVVGAISSGDLHAEAVAGLGSAICKVPPLMICNPQETATNKDFTIAGYVGRGLRLVQGGSNGADWTAGNFGYLQTTGPGANELEYALGANNPPGDCFATDGVTTKPGENTSVVDAINTRFDIYQNGLTNDCSGSTCSPSVNVRKDVVRPVGSTNYGFNTGNDPWTLPQTQYLPSGTGTYSAPYPTAMGYPRDKCHAVSSDGTCRDGRIGDGNWDRNLYFFVNHPSMYTRTDPNVPDSNWQNIPSLATFAQANGYTAATMANITRYDVYRWEIEQDALDSYTDHTVTKGAKTTTFMNYARPQSSAGVAAGANQLDRRLTSMAVINCQQQDVKGQAKDVSVLKWVEVFFVQPSLARPRTSAGDVYVEVVRVTEPGQDGSTGGQVVRRDVPYLIK
jgi:Flp pilus assembly protein TadG